MHVADRPVLRRGDRLPGLPRLVAKRSPRKDRQFKEEPLTVKSEHPSAQTLYAPVVLILALSGGLIGALLYYSALAQDRLALQDSVTVAHSILDAQERELRKIAQDHAWWGEAIEKLFVDPNPVWAEENLGTYLIGYFEVDSAFAVEPDDRISFAYLYGQSQEPGTRDPLQGGFTRLVSLARQSAESGPRGVSGLLSWDGQVHVAAACAAASVELTGVPLPAGARPVLVFSRLLDDAFLEAAETDYLLRELHWSNTGSRLSPARLQVFGVDGSPLGNLAWQPDLPGRQLLLEVLPWVGLAVVVMGSLLYVFLQRAHRVSERLRLSEKRFRTLARTDPLTGCFNRRYFLELAEKEFYSARRYQHPLSLAMMDVDHFKRVNDLHGHQAGDEILRRLVQLSREQLRKSDILGRLGGEEFAVVLPHTDVATAHEIARRLCRAIAAERIPVAATSLGCTISVGVAELSPEINDLDQLLRSADTALYHAKENGRNRVEVTAS